MDDERKGINITAYIITAAIGAALGAVYLASREYSSALPAEERYVMLCDAFTVPGMMIFLSGVLMSLGKRGSFDGIGYALTYALKGLIPGNKGQKETYAEYIERKREKSEGRGFSFLYHVGGAFLLAAAVCLVLYLRAAS